MVADVETVVGHLLAVGEVVAVDDVLGHLHFLPRETHDHLHHHHGTNLSVAVLEKVVKMVVAVDAAAAC